MSVCVLRGYVRDVRHRSGVGQIVVALVPDAHDPRQTRMKLRGLQKLYAGGDPICRGNFYLTNKALDVEKDGQICLPEDMIGIECDLWCKFRRYMAKSRENPGVTQPGWALDCFRIRPDYDARGNAKRDADNSDKVPVKDIRRDATRPQVCPSDYNGIGPDDF